MAHTDPIPAGPVAGIAEPHQSTVATILRAAGLGLFTAAEADMLINRVRAHVTPCRTVSTGQSHDHVHDGSSTWSATKLLTITTHPVPPAATVLTVHGEEWQASPCS